MVIIGLSTAPAFAQYMGQGGTGGSGEGGVSVSYTHLTLPTIYSV